VLLRHTLHPAGRAQLRQCTLQHGWEDTLQHATTWTERQRHEIPGSQAGRQ
jgi:hypothetical protein